MTFAELGIDSLVAVELRNSVEKSFGLALSSSLVFDYPTVPALSAHLLDRLIQARPPTQAGADRQDPTASVPRREQSAGHERVEEFA